MQPKTYKKIIDAALVELARNPTSSLEQIAEAAGVARVTLFRYFRNREQLVHALNDESNRVFQEIMDPLLAADMPPDHKLRQLVEAMIPYGATFRFLLYEPYRTGDPLTDSQLQEYLDKLHLLLGELGAGGMLREDMPLYWATRHLDALIWMAWDCVDRGEIAPKSATEFIIETFYKGVGRKIPQK